MGGDTSEREISLKTGEAVAKALADGGHDVRAVVLGDPFDALESAATRHSDVVFVALHGGAGEDGRIQALLELAGLPYVGSGPGASAVAMDKPWTKRIARDLGLPTADWADVAPHDDDVKVKSMADALGGPLVLKPADEGSAVGVHLLDGPEDVPAALTEIGPRRRPWMLERYVAGRELTVPLLWGEAFPLIEIRPKAGFYDYTNKYTAGRTDYLCPAPLSEETASTLAAHALVLYRALHLHDMARADFRVDEQDRPFLLEVNTIPGMTATSLLPMGAAARGISFGEMCERLCRAALERARPNAIAGDHEENA
jgi:D-alanine-D-alanine ligase